MKTRAYRQFSAYDRDPGGITRLDAVVAAVERARGDRPIGDVHVLDVGCGTGNLALPLASLGYPVKAIDVDAASITEAQRASQFPHASFECADPLQFVGNPPYQVIILSEVLEHLTDPVAMLVHLRGLLAPGGTLVLTVPNGYGPWELMNWGKKGFAAVGLGPALRSFQRLFGFGKQTVQSRNPHLDHVQFFTTQSLSRVVQSAGFQIRRRANLSCLVAVFPVSWLFRRLKLLEPLDASLARLLPAVLVSGWLLELDAG